MIFGTGVEQEIKKLKSMELAYNFNFLNENNIFYGLNHDNNDEILIQYLYSLKEKNNAQWTRNEMIYLHSIFTNVCKLSGSLQLDSYDALYELYCVLKQNNKRRNMQYFLRDIDTRIALNLNTTHQNHLRSLPFGLNYILNTKFLWAYFASMCILSKWFFQIYMELIMSVLFHVNNAKVSLGQVLYTEYFLHDRAALLSTLSENMLFVKTVQAYNLLLQFSMASTGQFFSWIWNLVSVLCFSYKTKNEGVVWSFFETHLHLSSSFGIEGINDLNDTNNNNNFLEKAIGFLPSIFSRFLNSDDLSRNTMKAIRLGATPSRDIKILMETIHKVTDEGEYILYVLSSCLSIFFLLLVTYTIIYLSSWFVSNRLKTRLIQKIKFTSLFFHQ